MKLENLWNDFLSRIKENISSLSYETWFKDTKLVSLNKDNLAIVVVPMPFHKKHLVENYLNIMEKTIYLITKKQYNFEFLLEEEWTERTENETFNNLSNNKILETPERKNANIIHQNIEDANLNKEYVFDTFIVGNSNRFAYTASMAVAEKPGKAYNPLFLYGKSGLGKTHLMHSIGNYIIENSNLNQLNLHL